MPLTRPPKPLPLVFLGQCDAMIAGETFLLPEFDDHLWAIISDSGANTEQIVIVLFVSWTEKYHQACVLHAGQHSFIKQTHAFNIQGQ